MEPWVQALFTLLGSLLASGSFWAFIAKRRDKDTAQARMLRGLAHDRIMWLGMQYIKRGEITSDEYENLCVYLYEPYLALGGNGSAQRVMEEVHKLKIT